MLRSILHRPRVIVPLLRDRARRSDAMVVAAALTCYAVFGFVPLLAIGTRVASWCFGADRVLSTARGLARFVPGPLHLDTEVVSFADSAAHAPWWTVLVALVPVSLYAEGTVRSLERFSRAPEGVSRTLRGRALTPVLVLLAVLALVVLVGVLRPLLLDPFGRGLGPRLLGVFVAFNVLFFAVFGTLLLVYRFFASTPLRPAALAFASFGAASWIAGQTIGYAYAIRKVSGFDNAFGRYGPAGEVAALAFLIYLQHLIFILGYLLALVLHEERSTLAQERSGGADVGRDGAGRERHERHAATRVGGPADEEQPAGA